MDFALLPPEINSARMYSGPGPASLLAAAGSWDSLTAELSITAQTYQSVLSGLTSLYWRGPAAESMWATAVPYIAWLHTTAEQTRQTAMQARAAAAAYELAYATTVPPVAVTANRTQLASLIATNFFGQNTPAIAATEAQYAGYWAQDATAMYGYAAHSAAAMQLTPFSAPKQTTNPAGLNAQNAAIAQANTNAAGTNPASQAISGAAAPNLLIPEDFSLIDGIAFLYSTVGEVTDLEDFNTDVIGANTDLGAATELTPTLTVAPRVSGGPSPDNVAATLARAGRIGSMSVPTSWTAASGGTVTLLPDSNLPAGPGTGPAGSTTGTPGIPGIPGGRVSRATGVVPRYGARLTVMARPPAAG